MLTPKTYPILERAVEDGVRSGYYRAFKHDTTPTEERIAEAITEAVLNSIFDWFEIPETPPDSLAPKAIPWDGGGEYTRKPLPCTPLPVGMVPCPQCGWYSKAGQPCMKCASMTAQYLRAVDLAVTPAPF